ncbi:YceI family protein [Draconibacterium sediminis]|uniref:YceI family protein n=1 Tax=Draconibacterium sediminis TaxID=1544798 RepID=UPI0026F16D56|nr:YceI family protein [Draconibacterium sediminis]
MKKLVLLTVAVALFVGFSANGQSKLVSSKSHIKFFSSTPAEDIQANNTTAVSTINPATGEIVFSVPMQGFEFEKALMQKHFNSEDFLNTKEFPKAKLTGKITNIDKVNFSADGTYNAHVEGELTIKGVTKPVHEMGKITVTGGKVDASSKFNVTLADYGITFVKGKPSTNIAKTVEVTLQAEYAAQ